MRFVFIDECHSSVGDKQYTAAIASVWEGSSLARFRSEFIRAVAQEINKEPSRINPFPTIHAAEMAKEYGDDVKLFCFKAIATLCKKFSIQFYHLGYFHHTPLVPNPPDLLGLSVNQLSNLLTDVIFDEELVFVFELNISRQGVISRSYNDWETHYFREVLGEQNLSVVNSANVIGRFYCDKKNYHMAATDTALYVRNLKARADGCQPMTKFKSNILSEAASITDLFKFDELIQLNAFPLDARTGKGPVRYMHSVTPSDDMDLSVQFENFLEQLRIYWGASLEPEGKQP
jgi:hypothetical protein